MKVMSSIVCLCASVLCSSLARGQDPHDFYKSELGTWSAEMKMWEDPNADPSVFKGEEVNRMVGAYWFVSDFKADLGGVEFEGHFVGKYNSKTKQYESTWIDSFTPSAAKGIGTYDEATKTMTWMMETEQPDGSIEITKSTSTFLDGKRVFSMYGSKPGDKDSWIRMMEIVYTKK